MGGGRRRRRRNDRRKVGGGRGKNEERGGDQTRNWAAGLPRDAMSAIFKKLGAMEILKSAQFVCRPWRILSFDSALWKCLDMKEMGMNVDVENGDGIDDEVVERVLIEAVDRSQGQLEELSLRYCATDALFSYIAGRTSILKRLRLFFTHNVCDAGLSDIVWRSPQLEELELTLVPLSRDISEHVGMSCPNLRCFGLNEQASRHDIDENDEEALGIANNMPELRRLQLIGNRLTNKGLSEILDKCTHLEYLDLRCCFNVDLESDAILRAKCASVNHLRLPNDPTDDCGFEADFDMSWNPGTAVYYFHPEGFSGSDLIYGDIYLSENDEGMKEDEGGGGEEQMRNWAGLPRDAILAIFKKLGGMEILRSAQFVCRPWRTVSFDLALWKCLDMKEMGMNVDIENGDRIDDEVVEWVLIEAVDRSQGQLEELSLRYCATDALFNYIAGRTSILRRLRLFSTHDVCDAGLSDIVCRSPQLEELDITLVPLGRNISEHVGTACPNLRCFRLNVQTSRHVFYENDEEALGIGNNMPELRCLQLIGNLLTNKGLSEILDKCTHLEYLDLRCCFNVNLESDASLRAKCAGVNYLRLPNDPTDDCGFVTECNWDMGWNPGTAVYYFHLEGYSGSDLMYDDIYHSENDEGMEEDGGGGGEEQMRNWAELPRDVISVIFKKLGGIEILKRAQFVCRPWRNLSFDPALWKCLDMNEMGMNVDDEIYDDDDVVERILMEAVHRSQGQLEELSLRHCATDSLFNYIAGRTSILRRLRLFSTHVCDMVFYDIITRSPKLEELHLTLVSLSQDVSKHVCTACPNLRSFGLNEQVNRHDFDENDEAALGIANNMPELRRLELIGNPLTNKGLSEILDKCTHLEYLDLRFCINVNLESDASLRAKCAGINYLRLPDDPTDDCGFEVERSVWGVWGMDSDPDMGWDLDADDYYLHAEGYPGSELMYDDFSHDYYYNELNDDDGFLYGA